MNTSRSISRWLVCTGLVVAAAATIWATTATATRQTTPKTPAAAPSSTLVTKLALARAATAKYVTDLGQAKADGYQIITKMIPTMGYHYMNPSIKSFDIRKPPILVYEHVGTTWQLGAIEWVFPAKPTQAPLPGATYGSFGAGCHYADGSFVPAATQTLCPTTAPRTEAAFTFWHPLLITMHVWLWYPNPWGLFSSTNPLVTPFNFG